MASPKDLEVKRNADAIKKISDNVDYFDASPKAIRRAAAIQANLAKVSTNLNILQAVEFAIDSGLGFDGFKEGLSREAINNYTKSQLRTAYTTTLHTAYNQGARERANESADDLPYWIYDAVDDAVVRPSHAALDGIIRRADDQFWKTHMPPNGFNCRCTFRALTKSQAARLRQEQGKKGLQSTTRELKSIKKSGGKPDKGFNRTNTIQNHDRRLLKTLQERIKKLPPKIRKSVNNDLKKIERRVNRWYVGESESFSDKL